METSSGVIMATLLAWNSNMNVAKRSVRDVQRFHAGYVVEEQNGCWVWQINIQANGYGHMKHSGKARGAHRVSYEMHKGEIPDGAYVLHRCDTRACVNPLHLYLGTALDNALDMKGKRRHSHGENATSAKLTNQQVLEIYALSDSGIGSRRISQRYGISTSMAWNIKTGRSWTHLYLTRYGANDAV